MLIVMGKYYWDQNIQLDVLSMCLMDLYKLKTDFSNLKRC